MKTKKLNVRLNLNKQTVASLNSKEQLSVNGGTGINCIARTHTMMGCTSQFCPGPKGEDRFDTISWVINPGIDFELNLRTRFEFDYRITGPSH